MKRIGCFLVAVCLLLSLTGCSIADSSILSQLTPPRLTGNEQEVQKALDAYLGRDGTTPDYTLKYPRKGKYRSAFILLPSYNENLEYAVAFYSLKSSDTSRVNLLCKIKDTWKSVSDIEGLSSEVAEVDFGDIDGDGTMEMFIAWSMYENSDRQLLIYELASKALKVMSTPAVCSSFYVGDMTSSGMDDLLLLRSSSVNSRTTAVLKTYRDNAVTEVGSVRLDGFIQDFVKIEPGQLGNGLNGVYIDCLKENSAYITELVYWDGKQLIAPFYRSETNASLQTWRDSGLLARDIDNDGEVEYPRSYRLPGYETAKPENAMWMTGWMNWNVETNHEESKFYSIMNEKDGYYYRLDNNWFEVKDNILTSHVTAQYDESSRILTMSYIDKNRKNHPFLQIKTGVEGSPESSTPTQHVFKKLKNLQSQNREYSVWYDDTYCSIDMEIIQYSFVCLK